MLSFYIHSQVVLVVLARRLVLFVVKKRTTKGRLLPRKGKAKMLDVTSGTLTAWSIPP
jgi:hypothetical protein